LRAQGEVTEVRAADLRFSVSEVTEFMNETTNLELSDEDIA
jgi:LuxR family transcriptional regulator, maltose regulon positive regulatory protein